MIIKPLISEDEAKQTSKLFQTTWQETYKGVLPDVFLDNIPATAWVKRLNESGRHNLVFKDDNNEVQARSEERRVGKECRTGWGRDQYKEKVYDKLVECTIKRQSVSMNVDKTRR